MPESTHAEGSRNVPIIVLGAHRTGTSLVSNLVHRWGAYGGPSEDLLCSNKNNAHGYFETRSLQRFLVEIYHAIGVGAWDTRYPERLREKATDPSYRDRAVALVASMSAQGGPWFWKEPTLSMMLPFWQPLWGDAIYVITIRDPYEAARSWERFFLPDELRATVSILSANLLRWQNFMLTILQDTDSSQRKIFVHYESLLSSPREECHRLARFLNLHCGRTGNPEAQAAGMAEVITPSLNHNRSPTALAERPEVETAQRDLYEFLLARVLDPEAPFNPDRYPMFEGWREYLTNVSVFLETYLRAKPLTQSVLVRSAVAAYRPFLIAGLMAKRLMKKLGARP